MALKYCQGTKCHTHRTKDRIKGQQGNKTYQTRRRSNFYYGNGNFCSTWCQNDWFNDFGDRAMIGLMISEIVQSITLEEQLSQKC